MDVIDFRFGTIINPDTLSHFCRTTNRVKVIAGISMDRKRVVFDHDEIMDYFNEVKEIKKSIPVQFIFGIDESGCFSCADQHHTKVFVLYDYEVNKFRFLKREIQRDHVLYDAL